jgi:glycogen debranching enzyme
VVGLEQADGTSWMAFYTLSLLEMAKILAVENPAWTDLEVKFLEHFTLIVDAMHSQGLWDDDDGFFYDVFHTADGRTIPIKVRSLVGVLPLLSTVVIGPDVLGPVGTLHKRFARYLDRFDPEAMMTGRGRVVSLPDSDRLVLGVIPPGEAGRVLARVFDEDEFLSPYGLRGLSKHHEEHPVWVDLGGAVASVDYEPAESTTGMFGGNSNWRGPVWMPVNYLVLRSLQRNAHALGPTVDIEYPTGSGRTVGLAECAEDLRRRLVSLFLRGADGRRPCHGWDDRAAARPALARQHHVQRVLPRRQRRRARSNPPDRVDRPRGRPHLPAGPVRDQPVPLRVTMTDLRLAFGRAVCGTLDEAARREWLVTDGLGGYASGTIAGLRTRRYHGLLMTATAPAGAARMLGLAALDVVVVVGDRRNRLATHEWAGGVVDPRGYEHLATFDLDDGVPRWRYDLGSVQVEVEVAMAHGRSAVGVVHRVLAGEARLEVTALCTWRDQHGDRFAGGDPAVAPTATGFVFESAYRVDGPGFQAGGQWYSGESHREEAARGLGATEDLWAAGTFRADLAAGQAPSASRQPSTSMALRSTPSPSWPPPAHAPASWPRAQADDDVDRILVRAADQFIVQTPTGPGAVAGYPWFGEWSRDLFTSYEGLFLCTGRAEEGRAVLLRAAGTVSEGMLANTADVGDLEYNTIDAVLWFLHALGATSPPPATSTSPRSWPTRWKGSCRRTAPAPASASARPRHRAAPRGRGGLGADVDGRARRRPAGHPASRVPGRDRGPVDQRARRGRRAPGTGRARPGRVAGLRQQAVGSFGQRFPVSEAGLPDLVDLGGAARTECRPNQLLAASLPYGPVHDPAAAAAIVAACRRHLATSLGLRSGGSRCCWRWRCSCSWSTPRS